jgi:hypothetical protein
MRGRLRSAQDVLECTNGLRSKDGPPVVGWDPLALVVGLAIVPDVPVPLGAIFGLSALLEPGVLMVRLASHYREQRLTWSLLWLTTKSMTSFIPRS